MENKPTTGKVSFRDGQYYLETQQKQQLIPIGPHVDPANLKALVGQQVEVLYSEPHSFIAGFVAVAADPAIKFRRILCYIPAPIDLGGVIEEGVRVGLAKQFLKDGVLSKANFEKLGLSDEKRG
jgi:hypothetical protein